MTDRQTFAIGDTIRQVHLDAVAQDRDTITALRARVAELEGALGDIAEATSAEDDAGENYRWDDREGALDYAYATARAALQGDKE